MYMADIVLSARHLVYTYIRRGEITSALTSILQTHEQCYAYCIRVVASYLRQLSLIGLAGILRRHVSR